MDFWYLVTLIGEPVFWALSTVALAIAYLMYRKRLSPEKRKWFKRGAVVYAAGILLTLAVVLSMKAVINIERPCVPCASPGTPEGCNPYCGTDHSFPSGHAATIFSVVTAVCIAGRKRLLPLYALAVLVASSRYFLGVHTQADIITGSLIGIAITAAFAFFYDKKLVRRKGN